MREIKFRAYDEDEKEFIHKTLEEIAMETWGSFRFGDEWTGLKDKNGVEIYEGDIVVYGALPFEIEYEAPGYIMVGRNDSYDLSYPSMKNVEVIGNIYENPELLKGVV